MKCLFTLCLFTSLSVTQNKTTENQRYQIINTEKIIMLDTQTGKTWELGSDSVLVTPDHKYKKEIWKTPRLVWIPIYFIDETVTDEYKRIPKGDSFIEDKKR